MVAPRRPRHLALQATELAWAAPQVVAHRLQRLVRAGTRPSARDRQEFARMGWEKVAAFQESWLAMTMEAWRVQQAMWLAAFAAAWLPWWPRRAMRHDRGRALMGILGRGLAPVHRRAVANARRLVAPRARGGNSVPRK